MIISYILLIFILPIIIGIFVYIFDKLVKFKGINKYDNNQKPFTLSGILAYIFIEVISTIWLYYIPRSPLAQYIYSSEAAKLMLMFLLAIVSSAPIIIAIKIDKEKIKFYGINRNNLVKSIALGLCISIISFVFMIFAKNIPLHLFRQIAFAKRSFWILLQYTLVGASEEFIFRGYYQNKFSKWKGKYIGWILTALLFGYGHIPNRIFISNMNFYQAMESCTEGIFIDLLFGYIYLKTGSIFAGTIYHSFLDWFSGVLEVLS